MTKTHLLHVPLDMRKFNRWAGTRGLIRNASFDAGYAFHILLSAMFGKRVLQPFRLFASERRATATLYAYTDVDEHELRRTAENVATPDCLEVIDPGRMRSKLMPSRFERGQCLGFDLRLRPVRRLHSDLTDPQTGRSFSSGAEVDAFLLKVIREFPVNAADSGTVAARGQVTRESVYKKWLCDRFGDAVVVRECSLAAVSRSRAVRGRKGAPEGPDAVLHGTFAVANEEEFMGILRHGVGRHRAYGYGMLLLRPPNREVPER